MQDAVEIKNFSVSFGRSEILRNITANFPRSGVSVLVGRSGSGKTTLLRSINRLNEEFPNCASTGEVWVNFRSGPVDIYSSRRNSEQNLRELRMRAGMLFQTPNLFPVSVYRNMSMPLQLVRGLGKSELEGRITSALKAVGLWKELENKLELPAERLSGGQQQRLCLARTLALEPELLLLDEPTASLDVHASRLVEDLLLELAEQYPVIMVSHSLAQAQRMGRRIFVFENGGISDCLEAGQDVDEELLARLV